MVETPRGVYMKAGLIAFIAAACVNVGPLHLLLGVSTAAAQPGTAASTDRPNESEERALAAYANLPLGFEAHQGASGLPLRFLDRGPGYAIFLTPTLTTTAMRTEVCDPACAEST